MKFTSINGTPGTLFLAAFLCCIVIANAATAGVDPRFDKGSASLAHHWQHVKGTIPHGHIPNSSAQIEDVGTWGKPYAIGIVKVVGPGFVIAILSLLVGLLYGLYKLVKLCFCGLCKNKDEEEGESESSDSSEEGEYSQFRKVWCPTIVYGVCWVFLLTGMIFGLLNNPRFSDGVDDMGDSVITVGTDSIQLANGLKSNVTSIVAMIPTTIAGLEDQFSGVDPLANSVSVLSVDINGTSAQVSNITDEIGRINAGNTSQVTALYAQLSSINNIKTVLSSLQILSQMSSLTDQIARSLQDTLNSTLGTLNSKVGDIDSTVDDLESTADGIISQATKLVNEVIGKVNDAKSYDQSRGKAVLALFIVIIIVSFLIILGYVFRVKAIFNAVCALSVVFLFLLWLSGSIHFLLGMALYDACPVIDVTVQGLLPKDSQAAVVLQGCLYDHRSVLESMNITAYNLTDVFDYKSEFQSFANFSGNFNFSSVDGYFDNIDTLYTYNLTAVADNLTVSNFGWNQSVIYQALDTLNNATSPQYYGENNYTQANASAYPYPKNSTINATQVLLTNLIALNATIYNETATAKQQLYAAQLDINKLLANITALHVRYDAIKTQVNVLTTKNITNCINILDNLQNNITGFFELGNCSFLGDSYVDIRTSLCETMQPSIDCLTVAQFLAGLALIPMAILAEVLSFRVPHRRRVRPCGGEDYDDDDYEKESHSEKKKQGGGYAVAMTDSPVVNRRLSGLTATVSTAPSTNSSAESTPASTPDFNANRRIIADHFENHD